MIRCLNNVCRYPEVILLLKNVPLGDCGLSRDLRYSVVICSFLLASTILNMFYALLKNVTDSVLL